MRIALVGDFPDLLDSPVGGPQAGAVSLVRGLLRIRPDLDITIIRVAQDHRPGVTQVGSPSVTMHTLRQGRLPWSELPGLRPARRVARLLTQLRPDVVHVRGHAHYVDGARFPAVLSIHGLPEYDRRYRPGTLRSARCVVLTRQYRRSRARYRHILANAAYVAREVQPYCRGQVHFVPNPVDARFFDVRRVESGPRVLFAGRIWSLKNVHGLIEAAARLLEDGVDYSLRLAGTIVWEEYGRRLHRLVRERGLEERVAFLGELDRRAMMDELAHARCLALPSFQEGAPNVISEAAAAGVPAVVTFAGGCGEMVTHGWTGMVVDPNSAASIAEGLRPLLESPERADEFGARARHRACVYRPETVAERTLAVYETVAGERAS